MNNRRIAIITARGGSKRIPHKNIRPFCGRPILAYSIEAALGSGLFEEVMVSTDDDKIAGAAEAAGARVPFLRSSETAGDFATTADVLLEVLKEYEKLGQHFDVLCCLYPTAPFVTPKKLQQALALLMERDADSVVPVVRYSFPPQRAFVIRDGLTVMKYPEHARSRSQDLEPYFHDCGQFYMLRTERFLQSGQIFTEHTVSLEMPETQVQDIDNETDWELAELKYQMMKRGVDG